MLKVEFNSRLGRFDVYDILEELEHKRYITSFKELEHATRYIYLEETRSLYT